MENDETRIVSEALFMSTPSLSPTPIGILIVDDDPWTTRALAATLAVTPGFRVLAAVHTGEEAITAYSREPADVVLMDINMGRGMTGIEATVAICQMDSRARVIVLTTISPGPGLVRALQAGAIAAMQKEASDSTIVEVIRATVRGDNPALLKGLATDVLVSGGLQVMQSAPSPHLTPAEYTILQMICSGHSYEQIVDQLSITKNTLDTHTRHLREKLGARTLSQLVVRALEYRVKSF